MSRGLNKLRSRKFPRCQHAEDLDFILKNNERCREAFGVFRDENFYEGMVKVGESSGSIFVCNQILREMNQESTIYTDGTFGVLPLGFKQLLILMGGVGMKVKNLFMFHSIIKTILSFSHDQSQ